jgi:hypothetical protein
MTKPRKYFSVLVRDGKDEPWCIHFGDYDRFVAQNERDDLVDGGEFKRSNTKVIMTDDAQADINAVVAMLNGATQ